MINHHHDIHMNKYTQFYGAMALSSGLPWNIAFFVYNCLGGPWDETTVDQDIFTGKIFRLYINFFV